MTAVLHDDVMTTPPTPRTVAASAPKQASNRLRHSPIDAGGDPLVDAAARLLSIPLRHVYAALWRVGVLEVQA